MKPSKIVRDAIVTAYCMDYATFCDVMWLTDCDYAKEKWQLQQNNFGKWFAQLDDSAADRFMNFVMWG